MEEWKSVDGYLWPYRINQEGVVQKFWHGAWVTLQPSIGGQRQRALVSMRRKNNKRAEVPVVWLMADAFMGGRKKGCCIVHKDGDRLNNSLHNLKVVRRKDLGTLYGDSRRRSVMKMDRDGNVLDVYRSATEAAKKNYYSRTSIHRRCGEGAARQFKYDDVAFVWEDAYWRKHGYKD